jgi:hypothetical protein
MQIRARMSTSADGYVTPPGRCPAQLASPSFVAGDSHSIRRSCPAAELR